jgi:hypothetical protein
MKTNNSHFDVLLATTNGDANTDEQNQNEQITPQPEWYTEGGERFANTPFTKKQWRKATIEEKIEYLGILSETDEQRARLFLRYYVVTEEPLTQEQMDILILHNIYRESRHIILSQLPNELQAIVRKLATKTRYVRHVQHIDVYCETNGEKIIVSPRTTLAPKMLPQYVAKTEQFDEHTTAKLVEWAKQQKTQTTKPTPQSEEQTQFTPPIKLLNHNKQIAKITKAKPTPTTTKIEVEDNGTITHTSIPRKTKTHLQATMNREKMLAEAKAFAEKYQNQND